MANTFFAPIALSKTWAPMDAAIPSSLMYTTIPAHLWPFAEQHAQAPPVTIMKGIPMNNEKRPNITSGMRVSNTNKTTSASPKPFTALISHNVIAHWVRMAMT